MPRQKKSKEEAQKVLDAAQKISDRIKNFSNQSDENLKTYEGSAFVQQVQANVAGRGVGTALGILGAAWTIYSAIKGAEEERKREAEQQKAKNNIMPGFNDLAEDIGREFSNNVRAFMAQNVDPIVAAFD